MQKFTRRTLLAAATAIVATGGFATAASAQTVLKWAHVYESTEAYHKWAQWAADEFKTRTDGRYEIEVYPASTLGKESDINEGLGLGTVDIIYTGQLFAGRFYGPIAIGGAPYMFRDYDALGQVQASPTSSRSSPRATGRRPETTSSR